MAVSPFAKEAIFTCHFRLSYNIDRKINKMISVARVIDPSLQTSYIARNGGSGKSFHSHAKGQGASGTSKTAIEMSWLIAKGANASSKNLDEAWDSYLVSKSFTTGPLKDRMKAFFLTGTQA